MGQLEVVAQHAVVEQQLDVVRLGVEVLANGWQVLHEAVDVPALARLLLHQQPHVVGHQVDAALQPEPFADERRL